MSDVLYVLGKLFTAIFTSSNSAFEYIVLTIMNWNYLLIPVCLIIIGFAIGILKRIIRN